MQKIEAAKCFSKSELIPAIFFRFEQSRESVNPDSRVDVSALFVYPCHHTATPSLPSPAPTANMSSRKDELIAKKARLAELRRQRELRQEQYTSSRQSIGEVCHANTAECVRPLTVHRLLPQVEPLKNVARKLTTLSPASSIARETETEYPHQVEEVDQVPCRAQELGTLRLYRMSNLPRSP